MTSEPSVPSSLLKEVAAEQGFQVLLLTCSDRFDALADELVVLDEPSSEPDHAPVLPGAALDEPPAFPDTAPDEPSAAAVLDEAPCGAAPTNRQAAGRDHRHAERNRQARALAPDDAVEPCRTR